MNVVLTGGHRSMGRVQRAERVAHLEVRFAHIKSISEFSVHLLDTLGMEYDVPRSNFSPAVTMVRDNLVVLQYHSLKENWFAVRNENDKLKV